METTTSPTNGSIKFTAAGTSETHSADRQATIHSVCSACVRVCVKGLQEDRIQQGMGKGGWGVE